MLYSYLTAIFLGLALTGFFIPIIKKIAWRYDIIDHPTSDRKIHKQPIPLLGGLAIFLGSFAAFFIFHFFYPLQFNYGQIILATFIPSLLLMFGGFLDDKYNLRPWQQIIWPIVAVVIAITSGIHVSHITDIFNGNGSTIFLGEWLGIIITFAWLMGMMYTTKFLDGMDGLLGGVAAIASFFIFFISLYWDGAYSLTGIFSLILFGSCLAFLFFNWHPAKIFLGEGGSLFLGFILGVLSIVSGSKIATTMLVMGIPALDVLIVILWRIFSGQSPFSHADRKHLHYRLLDFGLTQRQVVFIFYVLSILFGLVALLNNSWAKILGLAVLIILVIIFLIFSILTTKK